METPLIKRKSSFKSNEKYDFKVKPFFIGVTGGTAGGKTSICNMIKREFGHRCCVMTFDSFYKDLTQDQIDNIANVNFDSPNALDFDLAYEKVCGLLKFEDQHLPVYSFADNARVPGEFELVKWQPIVIFEGILSLYEKRFRDLMDLKIFVMTDDDVRLARRLQRDIAERGRDIENILVAYNQFVKKSYDEFIKPTMKYADIIIPHGRSNTVAIDFVISNLKTKLPKIENVSGSSLSPKRNGLAILKKDSEISTQISPEKIQRADNQINFVQPDEDSILTQKSNLILNKIINKEDEILKDDYIGQLLKSLNDLQSKKQEFNTNTMIFIPEIVSIQGEKSVIDFIEQAPVKKQIEVYTVVTSEICLQNVQSCVDKMVRSCKTITIYRLIKELKQDQLIKIENLNEEMSQTTFIQINGE